MKKLMKLSLLLVVVALTFSSCNCFKKMAKNSDDVSLTCAPEVLVLNNRRHYGTVPREVLQPQSYREGYSGDGIRGRRSCRYSEILPGFESERELYGR